MNIYIINDIIFVYIFQNCQPLIILIIIFSYIYSFLKCHIKFLLLSDIIINIYAMKLVLNVIISFPFKNALNY